MGKIAKVQEVAIKKIKPYENNAKIHGAEQVEKLKASIEEFGFLTPCLIDKNYNLIAGHGRVMAAKEIGMEKVPCVFIEGLTGAQRKAYILADNRLGELGTWDMDVVVGELESLRDADFDIELTGFTLDGVSNDWFEQHKKNDTSRQEGNEEYNEFLDKFEIPKTTDDCYTPDLVYDAVAEWVVKEYGVKRKQFVRPFYPGGDYQNSKYPKDSIVVDNPPFSILSEILKFYTERGIKFFLFAPALTLFSSSAGATVCAIGAGAQIIYENKANVSTSFLTNLEMEYRFRSAPDLYQAVQKACEEIAKENNRELAKNEFPDEVITSTKLSYFSKYGVEFKVRREESEHIRQLDAQKEKGSVIFGSGYLISEKAAAEKAAAEKAAAEKAAAEKWVLSDREIEIVKSLGNR